MVAVSQHDKEAARGSAPIRPTAGLTVPPRTGHPRSAPPEIAQRILTQCRRCLSKAFGTNVTLEGNVGSAIRVTSTTSTAGVDRTSSRPCQLANNR